MPVAYQEDPALRTAAAALMARGAQAILDEFDGFMMQWTGLAAAHAARGVSRTRPTTEDKVWMLESLTGISLDKPAIEAAGFATLPARARRLAWNEAYINERYQAFASRAALGFAIQTSARDWLGGTYYSLSNDAFVAPDVAWLQEALVAHLNTLAADAAGFAAAVLVRLRADEIALDVPALKRDLAQAPCAPLFAAALEFSGAGVKMANDAFGALTAPDAGGWFLVGSAGRDGILGHNGADYLYGGAGNDTLNGDSGNDVYLFNLGDGQDEIVDAEVVAGGVDTLRCTAVFSRPLSACLQGQHRMTHRSPTRSGAYA